MEPDNKPNLTPEYPKGPTPSEPTPTPQPTEPKSSQSSVNLARPDATEPTTASTPTSAPKQKKGLKIVLIIIVIIVLVIGGILISTFLLAPNLFKATAPGQTNTTTTDGSNNAGSTKSVADETLTQDILKAIYVSEAAKQTLPSNEVVITAVKPVSNTNGVITEEWSIDIGGIKSVYTVVIKPSATGGTDFGVTKKS